MVAGGGQITGTFWKLLRQPISETIYQLELLKQVQEEQNPQKPRPGFDDNTFTLTE